MQIVCKEKKAVFSRQAAFCFVFEKVKVLFCTFSDKNTLYFKKIALFSRARLTGRIYWVYYLLIVYLYTTLLLYALFTVFSVFWTILDDEIYWIMLFLSWRFSFWLRFPFFIDLSFLWIAAHSIISLVYLFLILCFCPSRIVIFRHFSTFFVFFASFSMFPCVFLFPLFDNPYLFDYTATSSV